MTHFIQNLTLADNQLENSSKIKSTKVEILKTDHLYASNYLLNKTDNSHFCQYDLTNQSYKVGSYILDRIIGKGNFSVVKLALHIPTQMQVAVKILHKSKMSNETLEKTYREVQIMKRLRHSNIVQLYQVIESTDWMFIIMEYVPLGELFEYLSQVGRLTENDARGKFRQILDAVEYCHKMNIVHRDLKAENLLIDKSFNIKLADFGFGSFYNESHLLSTWCGSPPYAAPELFKGEPYIGPKADIWSLGVVLYAMVCGTLPFDEPYSIVKLRQQVLSGLVRFPYFLSYECELLIRLILNRNPMKRPSILTIRNHKWMQPSSDESPISVDTSPINDPTLWQAPLQSRSSRRSKTMCDDSGFDEPRDFTRSSSEKTSLAPGHEQLVPDCDVNDNVIHMMERCGYKRSAIVEDLTQNLYGPLTATYLLMCEKLRLLSQTKPPSLSSYITVSENCQNRPLLPPQSVVHDLCVIDNVAGSQYCQVDSIKEPEVTLRQMRLDDIPKDIRRRRGSLYEPVEINNRNQSYRHATIMTDDNGTIIPQLPLILKHHDIPTTSVNNNHNVVGAVVDLVKSYDYKTDDDCHCCTITRSSFNKPHCCNDKADVTENRRTHTCAMTYGREIETVKPNNNITAQPCMILNPRITSPYNHMANILLPNNGRHVSQRVTVHNPMVTAYHQQVNPAMGQVSSSYCMPQDAILAHGYNAHSSPVKSTVINNISYDIKPKMIKFVETNNAPGNAREPIMNPTATMNGNPRIDRYINVDANNDYQASRDLTSILAPTIHIRQNRYYPSDQCPLMPRNVDYLNSHSIPQAMNCNRLFLEQGLSPRSTFSDTSTQVIPQYNLIGSSFVSPVTINFVRLS